MCEMRWERGSGGLRRRVAKLALTRESVQSVVRYARRGEAEGGYCSVCTLADGVRRLAVGRTAQQLPRIYRG